MRRFAVRLAACVVALALAPLGAAEADTLDDLAGQVVETLADLGVSRTQGVLVTPHNFYAFDDDSSDRLADVFARRLRRALETDGYRIARPATGPLDGVIIDGAWHEGDGGVVMSLQIAPWRNGQRDRIQVVSGRLASADVAGLLGDPDMDAHGRTLIHRLERGVTRTDAKAVYLQPLEIAGSTLQPDLIDFFSRWMADRLAGSPRLIPVDFVETVAGLTDEDLRARAAEQNLGLAADLVDAEYELSGKAEVGPETVTVRIAVHDRFGDLVGDASVQFPRSALPGDMMTDSTDSRLQMAKDTSLRSVANLTVDMVSERGALTATYFEGDTIRFFVRPSRAAHIYVVNVDSKGQAYVLYPPGGADTAPLAAGQLFIIPDDPYGPGLLEVSPPFGFDLMLAVASDIPLDVNSIPGGSDSLWSDAGAFLDGLRRLGRDTEAGYSEAWLLLTTRPAE